MMKKLSSEHQVDVLLMSGDFIGHGIAVKPTAPIDTFAPHYEALKDTMSTLLTKYIQAYFNSSIVLPSFGNNDIKVHY